MKRRYRDCRCPVEDRTVTETLLATIGYAWRLLRVA